MNIEQKEFIRGFHVNLVYKNTKLKKIFIGTKEFYWEVPEHLKGKLKKGDLIIANVKKKYTSKGEKLKKPIRESIVLISDVFNEFEPSEEIKLKLVRRKYIGKQARLVKHYIDIGMINKNIVEESLAMSLAKKCNLSEKSINSLLKKYDEVKVKQAIDMYLATNDKKAPLKFIKFILEKIEFL